MIHLLESKGPFLLFWLKMSVRSLKALLNLFIYYLQGPQEYRMTLCYCDTYNIGRSFLGQASMVVRKVGRLKDGKKMLVVGNPKKITELSRN